MGTRDIAEGGGGTDTLHLTLSGVSVGEKFTMSGGLVTLESGGSFKEFEALEFGGGSGRDLVTGDLFGDALSGAAAMTCWAAATATTRSSSASCSRPCRPMSISPISNVLNGRGGDDPLVGGAGADGMTGGAGHDRFSLSVSSENFPYAWRGDEITDFVHGEDLIAVDGAKMGFPGGEGFRLISGDAPQPDSAAPTLLFDSRSHQLWWDGDGIGGTQAMLVATFDTITKLEASGLRGVVIASGRRAPAAGGLRRSRHPAYRRALFPNENPRSSPWQKPPCARPPPRLPPIASARPNRSPMRRQRTNCCASTAICC